MRADPILIAAVAGSAASTAAPIQYTAQERWVEIQAYLPGGAPTERLSASGFGAFNGSLVDTLSNADGSAWARAEQVSTLTSSSISVTGIADGASGPPFGSSEGVGRSSFFVSFTLAEAADYALSLDVMSEFASWSFQGPSLAVDRPLEFAVGVPGLDLSGTLDAGDYAFEIFIESGAAAQGLGSNFAFSFSVVPAPGPAAVLGLGVLAAARRRR